MPRPLLRRYALAMSLAVLAASGLAGVPRAENVAAALIATGINDTLVMKHDRMANVPSPGVLGNDLNLLGGASAIPLTGVSHGTLSLQANGGYTYTPNAGFIGSDQFTYRPSGLLSTQATVRITITNAAPVAKPDAYSWPGGATLSVAAPGVLANDTDADGDALSADQVGGGVSGSLDLDEDGGFRYTPGGGFSGVATFSYRVWDGVAWSGTTTVMLTKVQSATPVPTPVPTPTPTPTPILPVPSIPVPSIPVPSIPVPSIPVPSIPPLRTPAPPAPTESPRPTGTPSPAEERGSPRPSASPGETDAPVPDSGSVPSDGTGGGGVPAADGAGTSGAGLQFEDVRVNLGLDFSGVLSSLDVWAVPAAVIGGPGLIVLLWIALQAVGATVWVPATRRLRNGEERSRRRR